MRSCSDIGLRCRCRDMTHSPESSGRESRLGGGKKNKQTKKNLRALTLTLVAKRCRRSPWWSLRDTRVQRDLWKERGAGRCHKHTHTLLTHVEIKWKAAWREKKRKKKRVKKKNQWSQFTVHKKARKKSFSRFVRRSSLSVVRVRGLRGGAEVLTRTGVGGLLLLRGARGAVSELRAFSGGYSCCQEMGNAHTCTQMRTRALLSDFFFNLL